MLYAIQFENLEIAAQEAQAGDIITSISPIDGKRYWYLCEEGAAIAWIPASDFEEFLLNAQLSNLTVDEKIQFLIKLSLKKEG